MGIRPRHRPDRVASKLLQIRNALGLSQSEIVRRLKLPENFKRTMISNFENDEREAPLVVLLAYAREAGICLEVIADDAIDLPDKLPVSPPHQPVDLSSTKKGSKRRS